MEEPPSSTLTIEALPRWSLAGASPEIDADGLHHLDFIFFLGEYLPPTSFFLYFILFLKPKQGG